MRNIIRGIKNLIYWLPTIWSDRDWDYVYTYKVLLVKLKKQREHFQDTNLFVGVEEVIKDILTCETILQRLIEDHYCKEEWDKYFEGYRTDVGPTMSEKRREDSKQLLEKQEALKNEDKQNLYNLLNTKIEEWWD